MFIGGAVYVGPRIYWGNALPQLWRDATTLVATQVIAVATMGVFLRSRIWKEAIDKVLERVNVRDSVLRAGLQSVLPASEVDYGALFESSSNVELALISTRHFLIATHSSKLITFLERGGSLTLVVCDPRDDELMGHYDRCFGETPGTRKKKTLESLEEVVRLSKRLRASRITVRLTHRRLTYGYHRFDTTAIVTLYLNTPRSKNANQVPAFLFSDGFLMKSFAEPDMDSLREESEEIPAEGMDAFVRGCQSVSFHMETRSPATGG